MAESRTPAGLGSGGRELWLSITEHDLDAAQLVLLLEACRTKDRLDKLDELLRCDTEVWATLVHRLRTDDYELKIDSALSEARQQANVLKQLLVSLRLPDEASGKKPQHRGARGAYKPSGSSGKVSSLERARAAKARS